MKCCKHNCSHLQGLSEIFQGSTSNFVFSVGSGHLRNLPLQPGHPVPQRQATGQPDPFGWNIHPAIPIPDHWRLDDRNHLKHQGNLRNGTMDFGSHLRLGSVHLQKPIWHPPIHLLVSQVCLDLQAGGFWGNWWQLHPEME